MRSTKVFSALLTLSFLAGCASGSRSGSQPDSASGSNSDSRSGSQHESQSGSRLGSQSASQSGAEFVPLFNGRDLAGWKNVNGAPSTWIVRDGIIVCSGVPISVLCTDQHYENYILELEWRHMTEGGNAGLFLHSDPLPARGQPFTRSTEAQILDGNHGDVFAIHGATMVPDRPHPQGWMRSLPTESRARPAVEWNHYRVESRDGVLTLAVNGKVVSGGSELVPRKGYICLESEGSEVHFRNIRIAEGPSTNPSPEETADVYRGFTSLYNGVDLSGWVSAPGAPWRADDWILRNTGSEAENPRLREEVGAREAPQAGREQRDQDGLQPAEEPESEEEIRTREPRDEEGQIGSSSVDERPHLWTEETFGDFELIADWRVECESGAAETTRSGIFLRGTTDAEIFVGCDTATPDDDAVIATAAADEERSSRGWSRLNIRAQGERVIVELDGVRIADRRLPTGVPDRGAVGLAHYGAPVEFANLFVRELE